MTYEIRKVVFVNHEATESYPLETDIKFDVYGVYHREGELLYWDEDFDTIREAEDFIMNKVDVDYEYKEN